MIRYNCYTKAKENPAIGYMKRMKQNWDIIHLNFLLSDKNLHDQASRIIKNKIVMETKFSKDKLKPIFLETIDILHNKNIEE